MRWCNVVVPGDPVAWERPRRSRNGHWFTPKRTMEAEKDLGWRFREVVPRPTTLPVSVTLVFRLRTMRRCDIDNLTKLVLDAGNKIVWADDQQVVRLVVELHRGHPSPGTSICVDTVHWPRSRGSVQIQ